MSLSVVLCVVLASAHFTVCQVIKPLSGPAAPSASLNEEEATAFSQPAAECGPVKWRLDEGCVLLMIQAERVKG